MPLLFPLVGVDDDGDGAVVHKVDLHVRAELPVLQVFKALMAHLLEEFFIARHGQLAPGGMDETRAFTPGRITVEREVGDDERRIAQLDGAAVQLAVLVLKNAQVGAFFGQLVHNGAVVGIAHAQQDDKARPDGPGLAPVDGNACAGDALDDCSHR